MFRFLMVLRIFGAMALAWYLCGTTVAALEAGVLAVLLHHFRTFDVHGAQWRCSEWLFNVVLGATFVGGILFGAGQPWLQYWLLVVLATLFSFGGIGGITYPIAISKSEWYVCCRRNERQDCDCNQCRQRH
jgi:hypothetical protein